MPIIKDFRLNDYISDADFELFRKMVEKGQLEEAVARFCSRLPKHLCAMFARMKADVVLDASRRILTAKDLAKVQREIVIDATVISGQLSQSFNVFVAKSIAPNLFKQNLITASKVKEVLLSSAKSEYESLIKGAMSGTESNLLGTVRLWQRDLQVRLQSIRFSKNPEMIIEAEKQLFKDYIKKKYPNQYQAILEGKVLRSRPLANGKFRNFDLEEYAEMSVTKTIQNLEANTVETGALIFGVPVVEYYLRDHRHTDKERDICQQILSNKINGVALLALDQKTASILKIMTLAEARAQGAMDFGCRHSIKQVDSVFRKQLTKALTLKSMSFRPKEEE